MDVDKIIPFYYNYTLEESDLEQKLWILNSNSHRFVCFTTRQDLLKIEILFPFVDIINANSTKRQYVNIDLLSHIRSQIIKR